MYLHGFLIFVVLLIIPREEVSAQCTLPAEIQNSNWLYQSTTVVSFGTSNMQGLVFRTRGENLDGFNCISNTSNVYVLKSVESYSDRGETKYLYMCVKLTKVSKDLFYFYLLADPSTDVSPNDRIYVPDTLLTDSNPTCTFCQYNTDPPDDDKRILQREGTNETLPTGITACLPCNATCDTGTSDTPPTGITACLSSYATCDTGSPSDSCADAKGVCQRKKCVTKILDKKCNCHQACCQIELDGK